VFHRVLGRRPPRRAYGHLRRLAPGREGLINPRQARGRAPAPVKSTSAADHRRLHGRGATDARLARVPGKTPRS
jgi:hypothetical protein